jgi:hypothetical protein
LRLDAYQLQLAFFPSDGDDTESNRNAGKKAPFELAGQAGLPVIGDYGTASKVSVRISLLDRNGILPGRSGLNWGQRPGREPNQAYIRIPLPIAKKTFFPDVGRRFLLHADDGVVLECVRAQQFGKAIESPYDNAVLGRYFRKRLGVPSGGAVTADHLKAYGRTDIIFWRTDAETFWMDFSNCHNPGYSV